MRVLDRKLLRDLRRLWAQTLAIALVMASGVATLILANGAYDSLEASRTAYYERNRFADVFATATRVPQQVVEKVNAIDGVQAVEPRIVKFTLLDVPGLAEPATGLAISVPDFRVTELNQLHVRSGRLPEPGRVDEVTVNEAFSVAHKFELGDSFKANLNGRMRSLTIVGIALSPEFIYAIGPGDLMPDNRRFGVMWMSEKALAGLFDLEGAFNNVAVKLRPGASEISIESQIDSLLERYGGTGSYGCKDQVSHSFIDAELKQLAALARIMPPIFLVVSAFLINITLSRFVALEREQIGLLKAIGYGNSLIVWHYLKLVLLIAVAGIVIGFVAGTILGQGLTRLYAEFFRFPYLFFQHAPNIYAIAALVSCLAAVLGAYNGARTVLTLAPAVAMQPPAPMRYHRILTKRSRLFTDVSPTTTMAFRRMLGAPVRSALTALGLSLAVALLVTALQSFDSVEMMIDIAFYQTERQDASVNFTDTRSPRALEAVARMPGVLRAEPYRAAAVRLRNGPLSRRVSILGKPRDMNLSRVLDLELQPVPLPSTGVVLGERVAELLKLKRGDTLDIDVLEGKRKSVQAPVVDIIKSYFGLMVFMDIEALDAMLDEGPRLSGVHISYDAASSNKLFSEIKKTPAVASFAMQQQAVARFRETLAENINYMVFVYLTLAVVIAFGIVYNAARIQLSERARELASLRVLGFTRAEVSGVLLSELFILTLVAIPLGWIIGTGFGWLVIQSYSSDLYRAPFNIERATYAKAALVVLAATAVSALIVRSRIDKLDLVAVLKTRD
jgi:putative ABC transport system permease protein